MKKEMSRTQRRRQAKIRKMLLSLSMVLVLALAAVGGTIAWLTDETDTVTNVFTVGNIDIDLAETKTNFKMIPGEEIEKDPKVTVKGGSENAWVFVEVEEANRLDYFISYSIDAGWQELKDADGNTVAGVYYREYAAQTDNLTWDVLTGNKVTVKNSVTKDDMDALQATTSPAPAPTLSFTAYAIQKDGFADAAAAWAELNAPAGN